MESVKSKKYQYGVRLTAVADLVSGQFGATQVDDKLEQRETNVLFEEELALPITSGRHRHFCIQTLAESGELRTGCA